MRSIVAAAFLSTLALGGCQTCPDGNTEGSLFCHAGDCADGESVCGGVCSNPQADRDNCGTCGTQCGDGMVCAGGTCVEGCDDGRVNCAGLCVDTTEDEANCGGCGVTNPQAVCEGAETCIDSICACAPADVVCAGVCTNPQTSNQHCGATADCLGANTGTMCTATEGCLNGACVSRLIYRGSLRASNGNWTYVGQVGIPGANADCNMRRPGSQICSYERLLMASQTVVPETMGATDHMGNAVTSWWIDDPMAPMTQRCRNNNTGEIGVPWTYATQDQGHVGKFVTLTAATGAISTLQTGTLPSCNGLRHVACCSTVIAP